MTDPTVTPEMYQFFLATNAVNAAQWYQNVAYYQGQQWIMSNGSTISWASEPKPEPIDPDLLMDEGL
jgi:hypothetical protein